MLMYRGSPLTFLLLWRKITVKNVKAIWSCQFCLPGRTRDRHFAKKTILVLLRHTNMFASKKKNLIMEKKIKSSNISLCFMKYILRQLKWPCQVNFLMENAKPRTGKSLAFVFQERLCWEHPEAEVKLCRNLLEAKVAPHESLLLPLASL